jgi:hypothetical protein
MYQQRRQHLVFLRAISREDPLGAPPHPDAAVLALQQCYEEYRVGFRRQEEALRNVRFARADAAAAAACKSKA